MAPYFSYTHHFLLQDSYSREWLNRPVEKGVKPPSESFGAIGWGLLALSVLGLVFALIAVGTLIA